MTSAGPDPEGIREAASRAALAVPGVDALQPGFADRLADTAARIRQAAGAPAPTGTAGGVRLQRATEPSGWQVEVRCAVHGDRRALDVARQVRQDVRAAVTTRMAQHGTPGSCTVRVTVVRTLV
jgi:hypothetical protein